MIFHSSDVSINIFCFLFQGNFQNGETDRVGNDLLTMSAVRHNILTIEYFYVNSSGRM